MSPQGVNECGGHGVSPMGKSGAETFRVVGKPVRVQIPPSAPAFTPHRKRKPGISELRPASHRGRLSAVVLKRRALNHARSEVGHLLSKGIPVETGVEVGAKVAVGIPVGVGVAVGKLPSQAVLTAWAMLTLP